MTDDIRERLEELERKREELIRALEAHEVADPVTAAFAAIFTIKGLVALGVSVALSFATSQLVRALTPAQKFTQGVRDGKIDFPNALPGGPLSEIYGGRPATAEWEASHAYALNSNVLVGGSYFKATTAGTSAGSEPTWPSTKGQTVSDGSVVWTHMGGNAGGAMAPASFLWSGGIDKHTSTTTQGGGKGFGPKPAQVTTITYSTDVALLWGRGPLNQLVVFAATDKLLDLRATVTGIFDPTILPDSDYDPHLPPNPDIEYELARSRYSGAPVVDGEGVGTGVVSVGGASFANYPGNDQQLPDPTIEADVDAVHGNDSTPAYRGRSYSVLVGFSLSRYGGAVPPFSAVNENTSYKTLAQIFGQWCDRTGVLTSSDYDFSDVASLDVRGLSITPKYRPREPMEALARIFGVTFSESDKIYATRKGVGAVAATVDDSEMGWVSADQEVDDGPLQELDTTLLPETSISRKVEFRFVNPEKDFEPDESHHQRQITDAKGSETLELQLTMYPDEAKRVAQREVYEAELKSQAHKTTLSWEYLWLKPGDEITITRDEGFTQRIRVTRIVHNVGPVEVEFEPVEASVYVQPVVAPPGVFEPPPVPIPAMSILGLYDGPLLRDNENSVNNGSGPYAYALKRTGEGAWNGATLYIDRGLGFEVLETFEAEATAGRTADDASGVLTDTTSTTGLVSDEVTVDLYGTTATLEGATDEELWAGANHCILGDEVCQIKSATKVGGFSNRWDLVIGFRARRGTDFAVATHQQGERFLLINSAVKFLPLPLSDLLVEREYKLVTAGQSLDDAATISFAWTGGGLKTLAPANLRGTRSTAQDLLVEWTRRDRVGAVLRDAAGTPLSEEREIYHLEIYNGPTRVHNVRIRERAFAPVFWRTTYEESGIGASVSADGTLTFLVSAPGNRAVVESIQRFHNDIFVEFVAAMGGTEWVPKIGFAEAGAAASYGVAVPMTHYLEGTGATTVRIENTQNVTVADGDRLSIRVRGGAVEYFKNYTGEGSVPVYRSAFPWDSSLTHKLLADQTGATLQHRALTVRTLMPLTSYLYTAEMQVEDFGSTQARVSVRVAQESALVGVGYWVEGTV